MRPSTPTGFRLRRAHIKLLLKIGLTACIGVAGITALGALSRIMTDITRSEETAAIFNVAAELDHDLVEAVEWLPDPENLPKQLPPLAREDITETWLRAWTQPLILSDGSGPVGSSVDGDATDGILEYFDGSAVDGMLAGADGWLGSPVHQIGHDLQLNFYADDGSVASVTAERTRLLRAIPLGDGIEWYDSVERYDVVFVLQHGNWRIHYMKRISAEGDWVSAPPQTPPRPLAIDDLRAITWRPSSQSPDEFWANPDVDLDLGRLADDMAAAAGLGFNTIRLELPYELMGGRNVTDHALASAVSVFDAAQAHGLSVIASLMHGRSEHQPLHWDADDDHLATVISALGAHPALVLWELASAPDLDIGVERVDDTMLRAWLTHTARTVRQVDGATPLSIGWSSARAAAEAPPIADVVSFAWTGDPAAVEANLELLRQVAGERPIVIADATHHTHVGIMPGGLTETEQARWFADLLIAVERFGLDGFSVSSLRDVDVDTIAARAQAEAERLDAEEHDRIAELEAQYPVPRTPEPLERGPEVHAAPVIAEVTWPVGAEAATGLLRVDGTPKPAASVFAPGADLTSVPAPSLVETATKPFHMIVLTLVGAGLGGWLLLWLWARGTIRLPQLRFRVTDLVRMAPKLRRKRDTATPATGVPHDAAVAAAYQHPGAYQQPWPEAQLHQHPHQSPAVWHPAAMAGRMPAPHPGAAPGVPIETPQAEAPGGGKGRLSRLVAWLNEPVAVDPPPAEVSEPVAEVPAPNPEAPPVGESELAAQPYAPATYPHPAAAQPHGQAPPAHPTAVQPYVQAAPAHVAAAPVQPVAGHTHEQMEPTHTATPVSPTPVQPGHPARAATPAPSQPHAPTGSTHPAPGRSFVPTAEPLPVPSRVPPTAPSGVGAFGAWVAEVPSQVSAPEPGASAPANAEGGAAPDLAPATLADALPVWPRDDLRYGDVLGAFDARPGLTEAPAQPISAHPLAPVAPTPGGPIALIEVDLEPIDQAIRLSGRGDQAPRPWRYAAFVIRAICASEPPLGQPGQTPIHVSVSDPIHEPRLIANAQHEHLRSLVARIEGDVSAAGSVDPTIAVAVSEMADGRVDVATHPQLLNVGLVWFDKRPTMVSDDRGEPAIGMRSSALLVVSGLDADAGADMWLQRLRAVIETWDWNADLA